MGNLADFVRGAAGSPSGSFEAAIPLLDGAGEGSPLVPEELGFEQRLREMPRSWRRRERTCEDLGLMNRLGDKLLPVPLSPEMNDRSIALRTICDQSGELHQSPESAHQSRSERPARRAARAPVEVPSKSEARADAPRMCRPEGIVVRRVSQ